MIGVALQKLVYKLKGEGDNVAATIERRNQMDELVDRYSGAPGEIEADDKLSQRWLKEFLEQGELAAIKLAIEHSYSTLN
jgi:regulator of protease activity HflC (stomatin/prohibitin superfamily)